MPASSEETPIETTHAAHSKMRDSASQQSGGCLAARKQVSATSGAHTAIAAHYENELKQGRQGVELTDGGLLGFRRSDGGLGVTCAVGTRWFRHIRGPHMTVGP